MSYRNGKLPFTGSIIADALIGFVAAYAVVAIILTLFGRPVARYSPGILTYFSFRADASSGFLGWSYDFYDGRIGPFHIGQSQTDVWNVIINCQCYTKYDTESVRNKSGTVSHETEIPSSSSVMISNIQQGS